MKSVLTTLGLYMACLLLSVGCVEVIEFETQYGSRFLVVEGIFTNEETAHTIKLRYTSEPNAYNELPVEDAEVTIIDDLGARIVLTHTAAGIYASSVVAGSPDRSYALEIVMNNGTIYRSSFETMFDAGAILDIRPVYESKDGANGISLYFDAQVEGNEDHYFYYDWVETYEVVPAFPSYYIWVGDTAEARTVPVDVCWNENKSNEILIKNLPAGQQALNGVRARFIAESDKQLESLYSIVLNQYGISRDAFTYWQSINEIKGAQGSFNDVQLGNVRGNMVSTNGGKEALGFFMVGAVSKRRIFITPNQVFNLGYKFLNHYPECEPLIFTGDQLINFMNQGNNSEFYVIHDGPDFGAGWGVVSNYCGDCNALGSNVKPSYWP